MDTEPRDASVWVVLYEIFQDTTEIKGIYTTQEAAQRSADILAMEWKNYQSTVYFTVTEHKLLT